MDEPSLPAWLRGKRINYGLRAWRFPLWREVLASLAERGGARILEVGSLEGCSALFFLSHLPRSTIVCVDPFYGSVRRRFRRNVSEFGSRVHLINRRSASALDRLFLDHERFDLIHIDGAHERDDVLVDSILAWRLLDNRGILIWDDYELTIPGRIGPKSAIDTFLQLQAGHFEELHRGPQLIICKTGEEPASAHAPIPMRRTLANFVRLLGPRHPYPRTAGTLSDFFCGRLTENAP